MADADQTQGEVGGALRHLRPDAGSELLEVLAAVRTGLGLAPKKPLQLGRYRIGQRLGRGGGGVVFSAVDDTLDRTVAVKLVSTRDGGEEGRATARLVREARALARLNHPNIVKIFDVGRYDATELAVAEASAAGVYIVMEMVEGRDLRSWFDDAPARADVLDVMLAAGRGLAAAHSAGVVHRDFKPANVLLGASGSVKVADFGLARDADASASRPSEATMPGVTAAEPTRTGDLVGTPAYMAPEQFMGRADERSDQFAFCLTLFEGLTGRRPFGRANHTVTVRRKVDGDVRGLHLVPSRLRAAIGRGLSPHPEDRFASMEDLLAALRPRRRWRWPFAILLGAAAVVPAFALSSPETCEAELQWSAERAEAVRAAIAGAAPGAETSAATVAEVLSARAAELAETSTAACTGDPALRECVALRRKAFEAVVAKLEAPDADTVERAVGMVDALEPASTCLLRSDDALTPPPEAAQAVHEVRMDLERLGGLLEEHRFDEVDDLLARAEQGAEAARFAPLTAEVIGARGIVASQSSQTDEAVALMEQSYWMSADLGHTRQMARMAMNLLLVQATQRRDVEGMQQWEQAAVAATARLDDPGMHEMLWNVRSAARLGLRRYDEAAEILEEAIPELEARAGESTKLIISLRNLGIAYSRLRRLGEADTVLARVVSIARRRLGAKHPETATSLAQIAVLREEQKDYKAAVALNREALDALATWSDHPHALAPTIWRNLAVAYSRLELYRESEEAYAHAIEVARELVGDGHPGMTSFLAGRAHAWQNQGRLREALDVYEGLLEDGIGSAAVAVKAAECCAQVCAPQRAAEAFFRADRMLAEAKTDVGSERVDLLELLATGWRGDPPTPPGAYAKQVLAALDREANPEAYHRGAEIAARLDAGTRTHRP